MNRPNDNSGEMLISGDFQRGPVPNTVALQESILNTTKQLPQHQSLADEVCEAEKPQGLFFWYSSLFRSAAIATIVVVATVSLIVIDFTAKDTSVEAFSNTDLEWQELMLTEDDYLFAQL